MRPVEAPADMASYTRKNRRRPVGDQRPGEAIRRARASTVLPRSFAPWCLPLVGHGRGPWKVASHTTFVGAEVDASEHHGATVVEPWRGQGKPGTRQGPQCVNAVRTE